MFQRFTLMLATALTTSVRDLRRRDDGQAVTEYGIVLGVLIVALAATVLALNTGIGTFLGKVVTALSNLIA